MREQVENGTSASLEQFLDDIKALLRDGEDLLKAGASSVKERAVSGARTTDRAMRSHPYQTMGIMFGLGVLAGALAVGMLRREPERDMEIY